MPDLRYLVDRPPPEVEGGLREAFSKAGGLLAEGNIEAAYSAVEAFYRFMVDTQPKGHRYHKGWPLHQMGMFRLQQDRLDEARDLFLLAFVEDALSRGEESPGKFDEIHQSRSRC